MEAKLQFCPYLVPIRLRSQTVCFLRNFDSFPPALRLSLLTLFSIFSTAAWCCSRFPCDHNFVLLSWYLALQVFFCSKYQQNIVIKLSHLVKCPNAFQKRTVFSIHRIYSVDQTPIPDRFWESRVACCFLTSLPDFLISNSFMSGLCDPRLQQLSFTYPESRAIFNDVSFFTVLSAYNLKISLFRFIARSIWPDRIFCS